MNLARVQKIPIYLRISLIYIFLGGIWIFFSDRFLAIFIDDVPTFLLYGIYKDWSYVVVTAPILYFILKRDFRLRQHVEDKLKKNEERYRYLFDNNPFPMWIYDLKSLCFLAVNDAAVTKYGYTRDEFLQMTIADIRPKEELPRFREHLAQPRHAFGYSEGWQHCLKDGKLIDVAISSRTIQLEGRDAVLVITQDITQRKEAEVALLQSEERFSKAFHASPAGLVISSQADGRIIDVNDSYCEITGYASKELLGKQAVHLNLWADPAERLQIIQMLEKDGYVRNVEIKVRKRSGDIRTFLDSVEPIELHGEKCIVSFALDITERKRAEDELRSTTLQLKSLLENMQTGILFENQNRCVLQANQTFCDLFNIPNSAQSLKGSDSRSVAKSMKSKIADPEGFIQAIETNINRDHIFLGEEICLADGRYLERDYIPIDSSSRQAGYLWKYRDITIRKQEQQSLQAAEEKYRTIFDGAIEGIFQSTPGGRFLTVNPALAHMWGYASPEEMIDTVKDISQQVYSDSQDRLEFMRQIKENGEVRGFDYQARHKNGELIWVSENARTVRDANGTLLYYEGNIQDITDRKQSEESLRRKTEELAALQATVLEITTPHDLLSLYNTIVKRAALLLNADAGGLYLCDSERQEARCVVSYNIPVNYVGYVLQYGEGAAGKVAQSGKPLLIDDYRTWSGRARIYEGDQSFRALVSAPMIWHGQVTGVIHAMRIKNDEPFTNSDLELLTLLANHAAVAAENARLMQGLQQELAERKQAEVKLRKSEERFRGIYENMTIGLYRTTPEGKILLTNPAMLEMLGYDSFEELAKRDLEKDGYSPTYERSAFKERIESEGQIYGLEAVWQRKDGSNIHVRESAKVIRDVNGKTLYYEGSVEDISDRKQAEEALREREARYRGLFEDSPISLWEEDFSAVKQRLDDLRREGVTDFRSFLHEHPELIRECAALVKVLDVNKATIKLYGAKSKKDLTDDLSNIISDDSFDEFAEEIAKIAEGQNNFEWEGVNETLDGERLNVNLVWSAVPGHENNLSRVIISIVDVTERKRAENALRDSELRLSTIFQTSPLPIAISRLRDNQFTDANDAFQILTGYKPSEIIGHTPSEINLWLNPERRELLLRDLRAKGSVRDFEFQIRHKSGRVFDMQMSADFIELAGELCVLTIAQDITARKQAEEKTQTHLKRISALRDIDRAITSSLDLNLTMNRLLAQVNEQLGLDAAAILLFNSHTYTLEYFTGRGFFGKEFRNIRVQLGEEYAGQVALERRVMHVNLNTSSGFSRSNNPLLKQDFTEYYGLPLIAKGQMRGVLEVFHRTQLNPDNEWLDYLETLAGQAAIAIDNVQLFDGLQQTNLELSLAYDATIEGWSHALDLRDKETEGHTQRVTELTLELARAFGLTQKELTNIRWGALLHDIGKMGVPDAILLKPDKLTDQEWVIMRKHPSLAHDMLSRIHYLRDALEIPHHHHEKWDGTGYPDGLKGEQIPLAARIFAIVDIWDAVRSDRPYRLAWTTTKALKYIRELSGTHLDPKVVEMFLDLKIYKANNSRTSRLIN